MLILQYKMLQERWKINETQAHVYSYESTQWELIPMNTNMTGFRWFSELVVPCALDTPSLVLELEGLISITKISSSPNGSVSWLNPTVQ